MQNPYAVPLRKCCLIGLILAQICNLLHKPYLFLNWTITICCLICLPTTLLSGVLLVPSFSPNDINIHTDTHKNWTSSQTRIFLFLKLFPSLLSQLARCLCWITWYSDFSYSKLRRQPEATMPCDSVGSGYMRTRGHSGLWFLSEGPHSLDPLAVF